jgi:hypothetical protein
MSRYHDTSSNRDPSADAEDNPGTLAAPFRPAPAKQPGVPPPANVPQRLANPMPPPAHALERTVEARAPSPGPAARPPEAAPVPLAAGSAEAVCRRVRLSEEAARLLVGEQTLLAYLYRLMRWQLYRDAVGVLAHALPQRSGIGWAWRCARIACGPFPSPQVVAALEATAAWLAEPSEDRRQRCGKAAAEAGPGTPAGSAALAVFWTAEAPFRRRQPFAPALEHYPTQAVGSAVVLAALEGDAAGAARRYLRFLGEGIARTTGIRTAL